MINKEIEHSRDKNHTEKGINKIRWLCQERKKKIETMTDDKNKKACEKSSTSNKSFELDPPLKDLASSIHEQISNLRNQEDGSSILSFEKSYPTQSEILFFAKDIEQIHELKGDFRTSINKIATVFSKAFSNTTEGKELDLEIQKMLIENFFQTARALAITVEARDPYTGGHSDRVFQISKELGKKCDLSPTEQLYLEGGALLHDVGKVGIRDAVLLKPGPLSDDEYKEMQLHPIIGAQIVKKLGCLHGCLDAVLYHHERIDGYGYPYGLKGDEIPLPARIASIADAYDAMTTNRIYRKAMSHEQALEEILRNSGTQFDSAVVKEFVKWWEETFQKSPTRGQELYKNI